ncbi:MAG: PAS domain-containing sensor histidine kinase, partial [Bacteroidota bacterium]
GKVILNLIHAADITKLKQTERLLRESEEKLSMFLRYCPNPIYIKDEDTRAVMLSHHFEKMLGKPLSQLLGKTGEELWPPELAATMRADDEKVMKEGCTIEREEAFEGRVFYSVKFPISEPDRPTILGGYTIDITESKMAEKALNESEARHASLISNISDVIGIIGIDGIMKYKSPNIEKWFGWQPQDLIGTDGWLTVHPDDLDRIQKEFFTLLEKDNSVKKVEYKYKCKNGNYKQIELTATNLMNDPIIGGVLLNYHDITERKQSERLLLDIIDKNPMSIQITDKDGFTLKVNSAHTELFGAVPPSDYSIFNDFQLIQQGFGDLLDRVKNGEVVHFPDLYYNAHDLVPEFPDVPIWLRIVIFPLNDSNGKPERFVLMHENITARKQSELEIKLKNQELSKLNTEKDRFFSIIAHDLRTPFNGFLGFTKMMVEELDTLTLKEIQKIALSMRNSASNLFRLLENLLEWSRMEQGLIPFNPKIVQLFSIIDESAAMVVEPAKSKGIELTCDIPPDLQVFADTNILQTVIRNLVSNAVKFTPKGGKVTIAAKSVPDHSVEISVIDTGIGMNPEMIADLFRLDVQTNRRGTENEPSSGLGLLICKDFVEKHGGKLWVESEEGKGSTFCF